MTRAARSVFVFSIYLFVLGSILVIVPNRLLSLFGIPHTGEVWIRVVGMLVVIIGWYYLCAARHDLVPFFMCTVFGRTAVLVFFVGFVIAGFAPPILILFGVIDALGAVWTVATLRADGAG